MNDKYRPPYGLGYILLTGIVLATTDITAGATGGIYLIALGVALIVSLIRRDLSAFRLLILPVCLLIPDSVTRLTAAMVHQSRKPAVTRGQRETTSANPTSANPITAELLDQVEQAKLRNQLAELDRDFYKDDPKPTP